jgi:hypothetical protein
MFINSLELGMSGQPSGGQGAVFSASQIPERSGLPSAVLGVGAPKFGNPLGVFGTPAVGYFSHWLEASPGIAHKTTAAAMSLAIEFTYDPE